MTRRQWWEAVGLYAAYAVILVTFLTPVVWLVSLAVRTPAEVFAPELRLIPHAPTLQNFARVLEAAHFPGFLWNGLVLSLSGAAGALLVAAPAAYAFSRLRFRGRNAALVGVLCFLMMSPLTIIIPLYHNLQYLGLTESLTGAALVYTTIAAPLSTWTLKVFFDDIPAALDDAAMIDGCTRFGAFVHIVLPLSKPGLIATFILTTILGWSQFVVPLILLSRPGLAPIAVGIFNFLSAYGGSSTQLVAAASLISVVPVVIVFLIARRLIIGAVMTGALKE